MKYVDAVLWRNYNQATVDTLIGASKGQYDIRLGSTSPFDYFFNAVPHMNLTAKGGYDINVNIEAYTDPTNSSNQVPESTITVRYMGRKSVRKDWYIRSQRPGHAYPLWVDGSRFSQKEEIHNYILLIRTTDGKFYGRSLLETEINNLPERLQEDITASPEVGMHIYSPRVSSDAEDIYQQLMDSTNLLMYGPPGTGKTTLMQEVVKLFEHGGPALLGFDESSKIPVFTDLDAIKHSKSSWLTFHQSYSYDEFIIGMMTDNTSKGKLLDIQPVQGKLLEMAEYAREKNHRALLVIDELNRANVSRVFGELITVIEPEKRLCSDGTKAESTVAIQLPYLKDGTQLKFKMDGETYTLANPFYMPHDVYIIASMNSIDKSIFPLDSALRRRFRFYNLYPNMDVLAQHFHVDGLTYAATKGSSLSTYNLQDFLVLVKDFMIFLNSKIMIFLGQDYTLGQSYVWNLTKAENLAEAIALFRSDLFEQIIPQLEELFRNRTEQLAYILKSSTTKNAPYSVLTPSDDEIDLGASPAFITREHDESFTDELLIHWMEEHAES